MRTRALGGSDLRVTEVGLGCNNFGFRIDLDATRAVVDAAIEAGVLFFDTADTYGDRGGSERMLGEVLTGRRDQVLLATKFGHAQVDMGYGEAYGAKGSRAYVRHALEQSLQRLRTDHVDLFQMHTPDASTPLEETVAALQEVVAEGKARAWGHSNFSAEQIEETDRIVRALGGAPPVTAQNHWSLLFRQVEADVVPAAEKVGVSVLPFFPLANGLLTGKATRAGVPADARLSSERYASWVTEDNLARVEALSDWARAHGSTLLEVGIGWLAGQPSVGSVIAGATKPEQVRANAAAVATPFTPAELAEISSLAPPRP